MYKINKEYTQNITRINRTTNFIDTRIQNNKKIKYNNRPCNGEEFPLTFHIYLQFSFYFNFPWACYLSSRSYQLKPTILVAFYIFIMYKWIEKLIKKEIFIKYLFKERTRILFIFYIYFGLEGSHLTDCWWRLENYRTRY